MLDGLYAQTIHFVADQGSRYVDLVGGQQTVHDLVLDLGLQGLAQFALHVLAHFGAEPFDGGLFHAELLEEGFVQLGQLGSGHFLDGDLELSGFAGQVQVLVVLGEGQVDQTVFETGDHAAGAQDQLGALGGTTGEGFAILGADEVDGDLIVGSGSAVDDFITGALLAQHVEHLVDVGVFDAGVLALDLDAVQTLDFEFGEDFEGRDVFQILAFFEHLGFDGGCAGRIELLLDDGFVEGFLNEITQGFLTRRGFVALTDDAHGYLARAETGNLGASGSLLQTLVHFGFNTLGRHANGHATLESRGVFNGNLHGYSSWHKNRPAFRPPRIKGDHSRDSLKRSHLA